MTFIVILIIQFWPWHLQPTKISEMKTSRFWQKWQKENSAIYSSPRIKLLWRVTQLILTSIGYIGWNDIRWEKVVPSPWESGALHHQGWVIEGGDCLLHWVQGSWSIEAGWLLPGQTNHTGVRTEKLGLIQASWDWNI